MNRQDDAIPDSFFDFDEDNGDEADEASEDDDSSSDDEADDASKVENAMLESIFGDVPLAASASDNSEDEKKMSATKKGSNGSSTRSTHPPKSSKAMSLEPDVREAGRKARMRLAEERSKRKEIRRIDDDAEGQDLLMQKVPREAAGTSGDAHKKSKGTSNNNGRILWTEPARKKRRRPTNAATSAIETTTQGDGQSDTIVDPWLPDSSSVDFEGRSNLVRVHGLPYGCKPEEIRRFFTGLNFVKVFVLASYHHHIDGWDCIDAEELLVAAASKGKKRQKGSSRRPTRIVKRYSSNFRVFVQFESTPGADQALKRSGETIMTSNGIVLAENNHASESETDDGEDEDKDNRNVKPKKKIRAAVCISPVAKSHATFLKKRLLAIDGVKGKALHEVVDGVEEQLPRFVRRTIWALAGMKLRQAIQADTLSSSDDDDFGGDVSKVSDAFAILERRKNTSRPKDAVSYRSLATAYNSLCDLYASIEDKSAANMALLRHDPTLFEDPVCRLTDAALDLISSESERIDLTLRWARETLVANSGSVEKE